MNLLKKTLRLTDDLTINHSLTGDFLLTGNLILTDDKHKVNYDEI